eukprot:scpid101032/ scgid28903/ Collectin-12; Collectin-3
MFQAVNPGITWFEAQYRCRMLGGTLAMPSNSRELQAVIQLAGKQRFDGPVWLGATDTETEGKWRHVSDNIVGYLPWTPRQPDNWHNSLRLREDCLEMRTNGKYANPFNDFPCHTVDRDIRGYLCRFT